MSNPFESSLPIGRNIGRGTPLWLAACLGVWLSSQAAARDLQPVDAVSSDGTRAGLSLDVGRERSARLAYDIDAPSSAVQHAMLVLSARSGNGSVTVIAESDHHPPVRLGLMRRQGDELLLEVTEHVRRAARSDGKLRFALLAEGDARRIRLYGNASGRPPLLLLDLKSADAPLPVRTKAGSGPWTHCANEGGRCQLPAPKVGAREVRFGTSDAFITRRVSLADFWGDSIGCDARLFLGDPAPGRAKTCVYGPLLIETLPAPTHPMGPTVDRTRIPVGDPGTTQALTRPNPEPLGASDGTGAFRTVCTFSHMNYDDPIVYPGQVGRSHLHAFFGNTLTNAHSTAWSIANTGNSTCRGGILNRSAYWVPALVDTRTGEPVTPLVMLIYYKTGYTGVPPQLVQVPPPGLRMIAGNMLASSKQSIPYGWYCSGVTSPLSEAIPANCTAGEDLVMVVGFPQCWDGVNLDSTDHKRHMAYPVGAASPLGNGCPASHPVPLPEITYNVHFPVLAAGASAHWRLSSDMYGTDKPGGYSAHGDWFNGWKEETIRTFVSQCDNRPADCHAHLLGDGREIYYDPSSHQVDPVMLPGSSPSRPRK